MPAGEHDNNSESKDPWINDVLGRKHLSERLRSVLSRITDWPVVNLSGEFGTGKTFFVTGLAKDLQSVGLPCVFIDAWKTDFADDPFLVVISEITEQLSEQGFIDRKKTVTQFGAKAGRYLLRRGLPAALKIATAGLIELEELKKGFADLAEKMGEDATTNFIEAKNSILSFRKLLSETAHHIQVRASTDSTSTSTDKRCLYVIIDELDRCRPTYAIEMLETIKHVFSVDGVVFIIAANLTQLERTVDVVYGTGIDKSGYLTRLIDWTFSLPRPDNFEFSKMLAARWDVRLQTENLNVASTFATCSTAWNLGLRDQDKCMRQLSVILRGFDGDGVESRFVNAITILVLMRMADRAFYDKFIYTNLDADELFEHLELFALPAATSLRWNFVPEEPMQGSFAASTIIAMQIESDRVLHILCEMMQHATDRNNIKRLACFGRFRLNTLSSAISMAANLKLDDAWYPDDTLRTFLADRISSFY
ncbi:MAG TPA: P-loop NTPase fold protein [Methylocella sp.]